MKVLIADDEEGYREYLRASIAEHGHEVSTVDSGRTAIDYGVRFRPQVLVTDWMLKDHIHGLRVSRVLRAVDPGLQTIVISGFPSTDLQRDAKHSGVFRFIEKPFSLDDMFAAIAAAVAAKRTGQIALFGVFEIDGYGRLANTNCKAREMLTATRAGVAAVTLGDLFGGDAIGCFVESNRDWVSVAPLANRHVEWLMRSKTGPDGGILVVLPATSDSLANDPLIQTLLEIDEPKPVTWPFEKHVLVIDNVREVRSLCTLLLEQVGCVCYQAESEALALKLFDADPMIGVVVLDYDMPLHDLGGFVDQLRSIRPAVDVVGTSANDHRHEFKSIGVDRYLDKGWMISDLIAAVSA